MFQTRILGVGLAFLGGIALLTTQAPAQVHNTGNNAPGIDKYHPLPPKVGGKVDGGGKIQPKDGQAGSPMCFGDGTLMECPSGMVGLPGHGCENSALSGGGLLNATGAAVMSKDTMKLEVSGLPSHSTAVFVQAAHVKGGVAFGDGILCVQGVANTVGVKRAAYGAATYPEYLDVPLCDKGKIPPLGTTMYYQVIYRDEHPFGQRVHFNTSNAWATIWTP